MDYTLQPGVGEVHNAHAAAAASCLLEAGREHHPRQKGLDRR